MKKLIEALKNEDIRITNGDRWMVWDSLFSGWAVYKRKRYAKKTTILCESYDINEALEELLN